MNLNNAYKKKSFSHVSAFGKASQNHEQYLNIQEIRKHNFHFETQQLFRQTFESSQKTQSTSEFKARKTIKFKENIK